jgi:hypothetical protein
VPLLVCVERYISFRNVDTASEDAEVLSWLILLLLFFLIFHFLVIDLNKEKILIKKA